MNVLEKVRRMAFRHIGAWVDDDLIAVTGDDVADDSDDVETSFDEPIFIHAATIEPRWEQVVDGNKLQGTDLVLRIKGTTPWSTEPLTVDIGIRGTVLDTVADLLRRKFVEWLTNFAEQDHINYHAWEDEK